MSKMKIGIHYYDGAMPTLERHGGCIDLASAEDVKLKKGEGHLLDLGVAIQLPEGCDALLLPRSSLYKNFKVLQTNTPGYIENEYFPDHWKLSIVALEDTEIHKGDRVCQFTVFKRMPEVEFEAIGDVNPEDMRGGFGSTGVSMLDAPDMLVRPSSKVQEELEETTASMLSGD